MPIVLKSGSLNLLEPSGSLHARTGIALLLPLPLLHIPEDQLVNMIVRMYTETPTGPTAVPPLGRAMLFACLRKCTDIFGWLLTF